MRASTFKRRLFCNDVEVSKKKRIEVGHTKGRVNLPESDKQLQKTFCNESDSELVQSSSEESISDPDFDGNQSDTSEDMQSGNENIAGNDLSEEDIEGSHENPPMEVSNEEISHEEVDSHNEQPDANQNQKKERATRTSSRFCKPQFAKKKKKKAVRKEVIHSGQRCPVKDCKCGTRFQRPDHINRHLENVHKFTGETLERYKKKIKVKRAKEICDFCKKPQSSRTRHMKKCKFRPFQSEMPTPRKSPGKRLQNPPKISARLPQSLCEYYHYMKDDDGLAENTGITYTR